AESFHFPSICLPFFSPSLCEWRHPSCSGAATARPSQPPTAEEENADDGTNDHRQAQARRPSSRLLPMCDSHPSVALPPTIGLADGRLPQHVYLLRSGLGRLLGTQPTATTVRPVHQGLGRRQCPAQYRERHVLYRGYRLQRYSIRGHV